MPRMPSGSLEDLLRELAPRVLGALVRRYGNLDLAEDAVQEALLAASVQWPAAGVPDDPGAWLVTVASRRLTDLLRSEQARRRREDAVARWELTTAWRSIPGEPVPGDTDDTLILLFLCCHPSLSLASQIALALRAVGGLTTAEIARAFLVPEATMTRRITRAKEAIRASGVPFRLPEPSERDDRLAAVLHVLYLVFNEGYATTGGADLVRADLATEAIRLARMVHRVLPGDAEVSGLLALMLLTDARRAARTSATGDLVLMADQDRSTWDRAMIEEGTRLAEAALSGGTPGPYGLQAAIAATHDAAMTPEATDWPRIVALYERLLARSDNPVVALNHAVAVGMARGPRAGLERLRSLREDPRLGEDRRLHAAEAHFLELAGERAAARDAYLEAARRTTSPPRQRHLIERAERLRDADAESAVD
jgi:RNA polymerase sigma factor (sigma-70 family)